MACIAAAAVSSVVAVLVLVSDSFFTIRFSPTSHSHVVLAMPYRHSGNT